MCDPVSISVANAATAAASAIMGFEGANSMSHANANAANLTASVQYNGLSEQAGEIASQQSENSLTSLINRARTQGSISASASALGAGGSTAQEEANAADVASGRSLAISDLNSSFQRLQIQNELTGSDVQRQNKIASVPAGNPLSLVLGLAKAGLQGVGSYEQAGGRFGSGGSSTGSTAVDDGE